MPVERKVPREGGLPELRTPVTKTTNITFLLLTRGSAAIVMMGRPRRCSLSDQVVWRLDGEGESIF
jgi:hypothetical protein